MTRLLLMTTLLVVACNAPIETPDAGAPQVGTDAGVIGGNGALDGQVIVEKRRDAGQRATDAGVGAIGDAGSAGGLFGASSTPATQGDSDTSSVELGVKFTSDVAGTVSGVRFFKPSQNTGTHIGTLWSSTGAKLASATFTGETASGWQSVSFGSPVTIAASTVYVASYHCEAGHYSATSNFFSAPFNAPPLHAPAGSNGVYAYAAAVTFPTESFQATNYWVDVAFEASGPVMSDTTAPSKPASLAATAVSSSQIDLTWAASSDNVKVTGYRITQNGVALPTVTGTSYSASALSPATAYTFAVTALDDAGNASPASDPATATTKAGTVNTACTQTVSPGAKLATVVSAAAPGSVICLSAGKYGSLDLVGVNKSSDVVLQSATDRSASLGIDLSSTSHVVFQNLTIEWLTVNAGPNKNITARNNTFVGQAVINVGNNGDANIVIDGNSFDAIDVCENCYEGRLEVIANPPSDNTSGVTISHNHFGGPGESDGIQIGTKGVIVGPGNVFDGIVQANYGRHVDSIQLYGATFTTITGNLFINDNVCIMAPDGGDTETITNNVFVGGDYRPALQFGSHVNDSFIHNTVFNISVNFNKKTENTEKSQNAVVRNNLMVNADFNTADSNRLESCVNCSFDHNAFSAAGDQSGTNVTIGMPTFVGGSTPATWAGFALTPTSVGHGAATDGSDLGATFFGP